MEGEKSYTFNERIEKIADDITNEAFGLADSYIENQRRGGKGAKEINLKGLIKVGKLASKALELYDLTKEDGDDSE